MSDLRIEIDTAGFEDVLRLEPERVQDWLDGFTEDVTSRVKASFGTSPAGETYRRGSVVHVASIAGYPPNVDTGNLRGSIEWEETGRLENTVLVGAEYGVYLEDGTEDIEPRPFMTPQFNRAGRVMESDAANSLNLED